MGSGGRNVRSRKQQAQQRRKNRVKRKIFHLSVVLIIAILLLCVGNIYARIAELQRELKRLEDQVRGAEKTYAREAEALSDDSRTGYADSIAAAAVGEPVERSEEEVLARLDELGADDPVIADIRQHCEDYPEELLAALANNPEMRDFAAGYHSGKENSSGALTEAEAEQEFPLFLQWDPRWGYRSYGGSCIGLAGCGPTCLSMALFYLTRDSALTPAKIADYSMENGYYMEGTGTAWALMEDVPKQYGLSVAKLSTRAEELIAALDHGGVIVCSVGRGDFTTQGHYIVIYGYESDGFLVNDPNCVARSRKWAFSTLKSQIKNIWAYLPS